ncbi:caspase family protein [Xinfangfangia sp. CPCC 101601]|uniref:Caspase family protein n=1 Tax=Pseudogemmobacter lacusdianii TaxID=3069608 RepID=A0ABU0VXY3_9RHOB|nr:caspase family protein [Xinfangfangia sp. CPCC 101601]MDQ2066621.1 caspase family protein [Xinfangfangia sp. CPCC 101601]
MLRRVLWALCLLFSCATAAIAERRVALVFATEDYKALRKLDNPVNDARAMESLLEDLGFEVWLEADRDLKRMRRALEDFKTDAAGADVALVFYAGHGVALQGVNYLLPTDADAASSQALAESALPLEEITQALHEIAPMAIVLLDACRDDPFAQGASGSTDGRGAVPLAGDPPDLPPPSPGLGRIGRSDGVLFAFAAAPGQTASDGAGANSPFTAALMRHLGTKGVELKSALTLVQQDVYDRSRGQQLPYIESGLAELVFIAEQGDLPERDQLLLAMAGVTDALRLEVEAVAAAHNMPLAPLYAALISADLGRQSSEERQRLLLEAAAAYLEFQQGLARYASSDPRVAELRTQAEEQLALGAVEAARALNTEAAAIDAEAGAAMAQDIAQTQKKLAERRISEATSHVLNAKAARTELRYDLAISDLTKAAELFAAVEVDLPDRETRFDYADVLRDLGDLQILAGNTNAALSIYQTRRAFAEAQVAASPADFSWSRELMWAWNAVGQVLQQQGHLPEAELAYSQAYELTAREMKANPNDTSLMRDLGISLNTLGDLRAALNDLPGALLAYQEGLSFSQSLLAMEPDNTLYNQDVSISHERIGDVLVLMGDRAGARDAFDVTLEIALRLEKAHPEDPLIRRNLSIAYERLGDTMLAEDDLDAALAAFLEAQKIRDDLLALDPGNATRKRDAAMMYARVGSVYHRMGDPGSALMNHEAARGMRAELVALDPANMIWARDLSISHEQVGYIYMGEDEFSGALEAYGACRDLRSAIAAVDPGNLQAQRDLAFCIEKWAEASEGAGDPEIALAAHQTALEMRQRTASIDPEQRRLQLDITFSHIAMAQLLQRMSQSEPAVSHYEAAITVLQALIDSDPSDLPTGYDLMIYTADLSELLTRLGAYTQAMDYAQRSLAAADRLIAARPGVQDYQQGRLVAANRYGDAALRADDAPSAIWAFQLMADVGYQISTDAPTSTSAAWTYALALLRLGEAHLAAQDYPTARAALQSAAEMRAALAAEQPGALQPLREHAYALQKLGESYFHENAYSEGLKREEEALAILRGILAQEPSDPWNTLDVADALDRITSYVTDATPYQRESLQLLQGLQAAGTLPEGYDAWIARLTEALAGK